MTENGSNLVMPVSPMYGGGGGFGGGFGYGGDFWLILILLFALGGWGGGNGFGGGGFGGNSDFPWLMTGQQGINTNTNNGFQNALLNDNVTSIRDGISSLSSQMCNGFGNVATQLCGGFAGVNASVNNAQNAIANQLYTNQLADLERSYNSQTAITQGMTGLQSQLAQCCCDNRLATCQTQNIVQNEGSATRFADANNTRDIIDSQSRGTQAILDKLCTLELDTVKGQLAQAQRDNVSLQNQLNMATLRESQTAQTAQIERGQINTMNSLVNELRSCPIPSQPVYGSQPIFSCPGNNGYGCGCGGNNF